MNGGIVPSLLLCATVGLLLSFTTQRIAWIGFAGMAVTAWIVSLVTPPAGLANLIFIGVWVSIILTAGLTYLPIAVAQRWAIPFATNAGIMGGALASLSDRKGDLLWALPASLLFIPGRWIVARGYGLGIKIVASWMIAIALLSTFVSLTPTPGYKPDHME